MLVVGGTGLNQTINSEKNITSPLSRGGRLTPILQQINKKLPQPSLDQFQPTQSLIDHASCAVFSVSCRISHSRGMSSALVLL